MDNMGDLFEFVMWTDKVCELVRLAQHFACYNGVAIASSRAALCSRSSALSAVIKHPRLSNHRTVVIYTKCPTDSCPGFRACAVIDPAVGED